MKNGSSRRQKNRGGNGRRNQVNKAKVYDSNGPDVRIRGTAYQVHEKYMALAKDSASAGDEILAESYLQHAEHYQRIINEIEALRAERSERRGERNKKGKEADGNTSEDLALPESILGGAPAEDSQGALEGV